MIAWQIEGSAIDLSYDYGHLFRTFPNVMDEDKAYTLHQRVLEDRIIGVLSFEAEGTQWQQETLFLTLNETFGVKRDLKVFLKLNVYDLLSQVTASTNPYGTLVGIRPVKLVHEMLRNKRPDQLIKDYLKAIYRVADEKIELMMNIAHLEQPILEMDDHDKISLYICIPFCRTRCSYCSFPANSVTQKGHLMDRYIECLIQEIKEMAIDLTLRALEVDCIYIGGGTPTSLNENQLETLLKAVSETFDLSKVTEFTVEAGRPDTLNTKKLELLKTYNVDRICINPQSMVDTTLVSIGRDHKAEDIRKLYEEASKMGFNSINMDLIAGLSDECTNEMRYTIDQILEMRPENVTLHTLSLKRASKLNEQKDQVALQEADTVSQMVALTTEQLTAAGYLPYYMYRQKQMIGNLENIGFTLPEKVCVYNVRIMEEQHSILALGAGAISKLYFPEENRLERFSNSKGLEDYIARIDEMIGRKKEWLTSRYDFSIME
jgi:coproporphyrinogen dehydrogenase HemZ